MFVLVCVLFVHVCVMFIQPPPSGVTAAGALHLLPHTCLHFVYVCACLCGGNVADITLPSWAGMQLSVGEYVWGNPAGTPSYISVGACPVGHLQYMVKVGACPVGHLLYMLNVGACPVGHLQYMLNVGACPVGHLQTEGVAPAAFANLSFHIVWKPVQLAMYRTLEDC